GMPRRPRASAHVTVRAMRGVALGLAILFGAGCAARAAGPRATTPPPAGPGAPDPSPRGYDALSYDLGLSLPGEDTPDQTFSFRGSLALVIAVTRDGLADLDLDADGLDVETVSEGGTPRRFRVEGEHLHVALEPPAPAGARRALRLDYRGRPSLGLRRFGDHVYTAFHTARWM